MSREEAEVGGTGSGESFVREGEGEAMFGVLDVVLLVGLVVVVAAFLLRLRRKRKEKTIFKRLSVYNIG